MRGVPSTRTRWHEAARPVAPGPPEPSTTSSRAGGCGAAGSARACPARAVSRPAAARIFRKTGGLPAICAILGRIESVGECRARPLLRKRARCNAILNRLRLKQRRCYSACRALIPVAAPRAGIFHRPLAPYAARSVAAGIAGALGERLHLCPHPRQEIDQQAALLRRESRQKLLLARDGKLHNAVVHAKPLGCQRER